MYIDPLLTGREILPLFSLTEMASAVERVDELLKLDPTDTRHLFWEELKRVFYAMRDVSSEDLDDKILEDLMKAVDEVTKVLLRIEKRRKAAAQKHEGFTLRKNSG
jgi:hypothetical protein